MSDGTIDLTNEGDKPRRIRSEEEKALLRERLADARYRSEHGLLRNDNDHLLRHLEERRNLTTQ